MCLTSPWSLWWNRKWELSVKLTRHVCLPHKCLERWLCLAWLEIEWCLLLSHILPHRVIFLEVALVSPLYHCDAEMPMVASREASSCNKIWLCFLPNPSLSSLILIKLGHRGQPPGDFTQLHNKASLSWTHTHQAGTSRSTSGWSHPNHLT